MRNLIGEVKRKFKVLNEQLNDPKVLEDRSMYTRISREIAELREVMQKIDRYERLREDLDEAEKIISESEDQDLIQLARSEKESLEEKIPELEKEILTLLVPKDEDELKNTILEIRAGTGGEEAALFVGDLYRMYSRYIEKRGWKLDVMNSHASERGGFKEIIFLVEGKGAYGDLKYESGVHRVQRVPVTEASGRIHTSTATVAVLPEAEEVKVSIRPEDLKIEAFRASGPGGQHVNVTDSAVRITHLPTEIVVTCQDERSQYKNKTKAMKILRARLLEKSKREHEREIARKRKLQVGTGERSEKIRTYNFPQRRVTDHRINRSWHFLEGILHGDLSSVIAELRNAERQERTKELMETLHE
ncbi:MAG: peptide chain release factor 1 [Latescibacteria bacterium DG_63]|nr:MAG: peptide chain release factor 1 [Latescibacteria bacterium DG_63]